MPGERQHEFGHVSRPSSPPTLTRTPILRVFLLYGYTKVKKVVVRGVYQMRLVELVPLVPFARRTDLWRLSNPRKTVPPSATPTAPTTHTLHQSQKSSEVITAAGRARRAGSNAAFRESVRRIFAEQIALDCLPPLHLGGRSP